MARAESLGLLSALAPDRLAMGSAALCAQNGVTGQLL